jgi:hypothetical protein
MKRLLIFSIILTLVGIQVACDKSDNRGMSDIQREEEFDRRDVMERDSFYDDNSFNEVQEEDLIINEDEDRK